MIRHHSVLVATAGADRKAPHVIRLELADMLNTYMNPIGHCGVWRLGRLLHGRGLRCLIRRIRWILGFCRTHTLMGLNKVAFDGLISVREICFSIAKDEAWPSLIFPCLYGIRPGSEDGKSSRIVEVAD